MRKRCISVGSTLVVLLGTVSDPRSLVHAGAELTASGRTVLGVEGSRFTLNASPAFLVGFSYYGALGASEDFVRKDLGDFQSRGFNWLRVWATWASFDNDVSAVDTKGEPRQPFLNKLDWLLAECDRRGLVVDVTLTRGKGSPGAVARGRLPDLEAHQRAVESLVTALKPHRNWYLDLANERDVRDDRYVSVAELKALRDLARKLDPQRLVTASFGGHELSREDIRESLRTRRLFDQLDSEELKVVAGARTLLAETFSRPAYPLKVGPTKR